ncbi:MAG TPA: phosphomannomutase/phosphoglucomutase [Cellvibrionaceae bacterium]
MSKSAQGQTAPDTAVDTDNQPKRTRAERRAADARAKLLAQRQRMLLILLGCALVVNALVGYFLYETMVVETQRQRIATTAEQAASTTAASVRNFLREREAEVRQWAATPALQKAIADGDTNTLNSLLAGFAKSRDDILAARTFTPNQLMIDREHSAPIRYAELDMLRRSLRRQQTQPEAAILDDGQWQLHIASAIPPEGERSAPASLLVTYSSTTVEQLFNPLGTERGQALLIQRFENINAPLFTMGAGKAAPSAKASIPNSYWQVEYTPSAALVAASEELPGLWLVVISLCVAASLALALILSKLIVRASKVDDSEGLSLPQGYVDSHSGSNSNANPITKPEAAVPGSLYGNEDILDIEVIEEDADILGLIDRQQERSTATSSAEQSLPDEIFRAYDIRGKVGSQLTAKLAYEIGLALGSEVQDQGENSLIVARDGRTHSPELAQQLIAGILASGCDVLDIGIAPTPLMHYATCEFTETSSGVMVTASHNGADDNGFKMVINGNTLSDKGIADLKNRIKRRQYLSGEGQQQTRSVIPEYIDRIFSDVALAGDITLVVDAANAVTGVVAPALFEELGCQVIPLNCELDGNFPNHAPDPTIVSNLAQLQEAVQTHGADLGVAFDGDGDRLMVVTPKGHIIWPDQLLMLFARDILARNPGADVLFDVKCSKQLNQLISGYGGRPIMWKTGHAHMKQKMIETGALIGGEYSGHIFIKERWYGFDDGLYTAARLLEIITLRDQSIDDVFAAFPMLPSTPEYRVAVPEAEKFSLIEKLIETGDFQSGKATTIDGLRIDFPKGWGLVRASNTAAEITLRFEAESDDLLEKIQQLFKRELLKVNKTLALDF